MAEYNYDQQLAQMVLGRGAAPATDTDSLATAAAGTPVNGPAPDPQLLVDKFRQIASLSPEDAAAQVRERARALAGPQNVTLASPTGELTTGNQPAQPTMAFPTGEQPIPQGAPAQLTPDAAAAQVRAMAGGTPPINVTTPTANVQGGGPAAMLGGMAKGNVGAERGTSGRLGGGGAPSGGNSATNPSDLALSDAANNQESIIRQQVAEETGPELMRRANQQGQAVDRYMEISQQVQDHTMDALAKYQKIGEDFMNSKVDPSQWFTTRDFGGKVAAATAMGLGAFGAALNGGENAPAKMIAKMVDDNIQEQKDAIERKRQGGGMMLDLAKQYQAAGASANQAIDMASTTMKAFGAQYVQAVTQNIGGASLAQAQGWRQQVEDHLKIKESAAKVIQQQAAASIDFVGAKEKAQTIRRQDEIDASMGGPKPAGYTMVPGTSTSLPKERTDKIVESRAASGSLDSALNDYQKALESPDGILQSKREATAGAALGELGAYFKAAKAAGGDESKINDMTSMVSTSKFKNAFMSKDAREKVLIVRHVIRNIQKSVDEANGLQSAKIRER